MYLCMQADRFAKCISETSNLTENERQVKHCQVRCQGTELIFSFPVYIPFGLNSPSHFSQFTLPTLELCNYSFYFPPLFFHISTCISLPFTPHYPHLTPHHSNIYISTLKHNFYIHMEPTIDSPSSIHSHCSFAFTYTHMHLYSSLLLVDTFKHPSLFLFLIPPSLNRIASQFLTLYQYFFTISNFSHLFLDNRTNVQSIKTLSFSS